MADDQVVENEEPPSVIVVEKKKKRRLSASEYQKYIVMEQGMEVDSQGEAHLAEEEEEADVLSRIPSWLAVSESKSIGSELGDSYVHIEKPRTLEDQFWRAPTRTKWQRFKAEVCEVFHELLQYGKNKSWKKKVLTVIVCGSSILVFYDLLFVGNIAKWLVNFILWMGDHIVAGIFAFIGIFVITTRAYFAVYLC